MQGRRVRTVEKWLIARLSWRAPSTTLDISASEARPAEAPPHLFVRAPQHADRAQDRPARAELEWSRQQPKSQARKKASSALSQCPAPCRSPHGLYPPVAGLFQIASVQTTPFPNVAHTLCLFCAGRKGNCPGGVDGPSALEKSNTRAAHTSCTAGGTESSPTRQVTLLPAQVDGTENSGRA